MTEGKIRSGYEGCKCAVDSCQAPLTAETEAYLHKDRETDKLLMLCRSPHRVRVSVRRVTLSAASRRNGAAMTVDRPMQAVGKQRRRLSRWAMDVLGTEWGGNANAPGDGHTLRVPLGRGSEHVYSFTEDAGTLWMGWPEGWEWHVGRKEARRLAVFILRQWAWTEWFGLRRWLWFKALTAECNRNRVRP